MSASTCTVATRVSCNKQHLSVNYIIAPTVSAPKQTQFAPKQQHQLSNAHIVGGAGSRCLGCRTQKCQHFQHNQNCSPHRSFSHSPRHAAPPAVRWCQQTPPQRQPRLLTRRKRRVQSRHASAWRTTSPCAASAWLSKVSSRHGAKIHQRPMVCVHPDTCQDCRRQRGTLRSIGPASVLRRRCTPHGLVSQRAQSAPSVRSAPHPPQGCG